MGSITQRKRKDGSMAYLAQIVIKQDGEVVHRENKTFPAKREAAGWIARREDELTRNSAPLIGGRARDVTLGEAIDRYIRESVKQIGRTKAQVLRSIKAHSLGAMRCSKITSRELLDFARGLLKGGAQPQTVQNYLSHLSSLFVIARPAWGYPLDEQAIKDAMIVAKRLGVISKSRSRDRRPTIDELNRLLEYFTAGRSRRADSNPMADIVLFALFSTRRQEEITRITWADLDDVHARVLVRDMKHPGQKIGNDQWCDLPPEALAIALRQPRVDARIFPANVDAISAAFTRACKVLGIQDLHFHDLRHDGVSRLFELGRNIPQVACVSGHRSWTSLKRYTHIRQSGDKYAGWRWRPEKTRRAAGRTGGPVETTGQGFRAS